MSQRIATVPIVMSGVQIITCDCRWAETWVRSCFFPPLVIVDREKWCPVSDLCSEKELLLVFSLAFCAFFNNIHSKLPWKETKRSVDIVRRRITKVYSSMAHHWRKSSCAQANVDTRQRWISQRWKCVVCRFSHCPRGVIHTSVCWIGSFHRLGPVQVVLYSIQTGDNHTRT